MTMTAAPPGTILPLPFSSFFLLTLQMHKKSKAVAAAVAVSKPLTPTSSPSSIKSSQPVYRQIKVNVVRGIDPFSLRG